MKKIFTLIAATLLISAASFAADRRPVVTLRSNSNFEIVIDGRIYSNGSGFTDLSHMRRGQHSIKVYEISRGRGLGIFFGRSRRLVDASVFSVMNSDVNINVDFRGQIRIMEDRFDHDRRGDWNNGYGHDRGHQDDRDWNRNY